MEEKNIRSNIIKLYYIKALRWFLLVMPIIVLFFQENGLSMTEILILQSAFSLSIILFEIPSGYFSDVVGRKITIIIACVLGFAGYLAYSLAYNFGQFLIAEIILGFSSSFLSGTDSAMIYDTLAQLKEEKKYQKVEGRLMSIGNFSEGIASLIAGFVATISLRVPFYIETVFILFAIPIALSLKEPIRRRYQSPEGNIKGIMKIVTHSLHHHSQIKWLIIYAGFVSSSTLTMVFFIQPYFQLVNLPLQFFGIVWAIFNLSVGIFSLLAYKLEIKLGRKTSLISLIFFPFAGYLLLSLTQSLWSLIFMIPFYFTRAISYPILKDYVNRLVSSDMRATVLSIKNLVGRFIFAVMGPIVGYAADVYTLRAALAASGIIFFVLSASSLLFLKKYKAL
ncbi:MAG: MFS transporter [bacterium]|nr:MFS transporter [bacterium]